MPRTSYREGLVQDTIKYFMDRDSAMPPNSLSSSEMHEQIVSDLEALMVVYSHRYLNEHIPQPRSLSLYLAFKYEAQDDVRQFQQMLRVLPHIFRTLEHLIKDHPVFHNQSNNEQTPIERQLPLTLYQLGRYRNGVSWADLSNIAGISQGSIQNFT